MQLAPVAADLLLELLQLVELRRLGVVERSTQVETVDALMQEPALTADQLFLTIKGGQLVGAAGDGNARCHGHETFYRQQRQLS